VKPAAIRSGSKLWKMADIIEAVNTRTEAPLITRSYNGGALTGLAAETALAFEKYDQAFDEMVELPSVSERRAATYRLAALAEEAFAEHDRDVDGGPHPEHVELKGQRVCQLLVLGLEGPCGWTSSQAWEWFNADDGKDSEAA
jgi:hypothetical protein